MASLQKPIRGYADYIGRFTGGRVNLDDSTTLVPVIQMEDFLNERKQLAFDTEFTAVDQIAGITVPEGKQWRVHYVAVYLSAQTGQQILYELHWKRVFGGFSREYPIEPVVNTVLSNADVFSNNAGATKGQSVYPNLIIPAGDGLGVAVSAMIGGGTFSTRFICQITEYAN